MATELKPCPFCGGEANLHFNDDADYWIECESCEASTKTGDDPLIAERWNRRAEPTAPPAAMASRLADFERQLIDRGKQLDAWEELEGKLCPEDVGFEEFIRALTARAEKAEAELDALAQMSASWSVRDAGGHCWKCDRHYMSAHAEGCTMEADVLAADEIVDRLHQKRAAVPSPEGRS